VIEYLIWFQMRGIYYKNFSEHGCFRKKALFEDTSQWNTDETDETDQHG
jgi:hypothetical protein